MEDGDLATGKSSNLRGALHGIFKHLGYMPTIQDQSRPMQGAEGGQRMRVVMLAFGVVAAMAGVVHAESFNLICGGSGYAVRPTFGMVVVNNFQGQGAIGNSIGSQQVAFRDTLTINVNGRRGAVLVPPALVPAIAGGGHDGWWPLEKITVTGTNISARFGFNFLNHPLLNINRYTGQVQVSGLGLAFSGVCQAYDPATVQKKF